MTTEELFYENFYDNLSPYLTAKSAAEHCNNLGSKVQKELSECLGIKVEHEPFSYNTDKKNPSD